MKYSWSDDALFHFFSFVKYAMRDGLIKCITYRFLKEECGEQGKELLPCIWLLLRMKLPYCDRNNKMNKDVNRYDIGLIHHDMAPLGM